MRKPLRGDIWLAELKRSDGCVIYGTRPVVVMNRCRDSRHSGVITVVPVTSRAKRPMDCHVDLAGHGLDRASVALTEQITAISRSSLKTFIGSLAGTPELQRIELALKRRMFAA